MNNIFKYSLYSLCLSLALGNTVLAEPGEDVDLIAPHPVDIIQLEEPPIQEPQQVTAPVKQINIDRTNKHTADVKDKENFVDISVNSPFAKRYYELFEIYMSLSNDMDKQGLQAIQSLLDLGDEEDLYLQSYRAHVKAKAALVLSGNKSGIADRLRQSAFDDLKFLDGWMKKYGRRITVHGYQEPDWLNGRVDVASQAILALCDLENYQPDKDNRDYIRKLSEGVKMLLHPESHRYPFGSHFSYVTAEGKPRTYAVPESEDYVSGAMLFPERQYAAMALARASLILQDDELLSSAECEGLGLLSKLALSGNIPYSLSPRPENEKNSILGDVAVVENLLALKEISGNHNLYGTLAGCAAINIENYAQTKQYVKVNAFVKELLAKANFKDWIGAKNLKKPFTGTVFELEDGKAVTKAFEAYDIEYPGGTKGKIVVVGRDNMFWMRFDVEREDPYYFYLNFLKSNFSGALVSIMMRIDGDKIFKVNLGGATDDTFMDCEYIDGPRFLRQGPHSFGVRFAGLLMKSPAILDSISIEPAVSRKWVKLDDGRSLLVMHSMAHTNIKTRMQELEVSSNQELNWQIFEGTGKLSVKNLSIDKRGRVWLDVPAGGTVIIEWPIDCDMSSVISECENRIGYN